MDQPFRETGALALAYKSSVLLRYRQIIMKLRIGLLVLGALLVLAGILMPRDWYDALPRNLESGVPPVKGVTLLQISLVVEGLALAAVSLMGWRFVRLEQSHLLRSPSISPINDFLSQRTALVLLLAITLLALGLRLVNLGSDLWLDEISTVVIYGPMSLIEVVGGYVNFNNHLLNTLLIKLSMALFGETEWAVRLPVVLLGTATVPVMYWISRQLGFSRGVSLAITLLLAVSYHHIFFSQNARGYIGLVLFSLLTSGLLVKALQADRLRWWVLYVAAMFLNFTTLLTSAYVLAAHMLVGAIAAILIWRRGIFPLPLLRRLGMVFGLAGFLAFQMYALVLPHAYLRAQAKYTSDSGYFSLFSTDLAAELVRNISAAVGIGSGPQAAAVLAVGAIIAATGLVVLVRRHWALTLALTLPSVLSLLFLLVSDTTFSPRFFLPALPVALLATVQGVYTLGEYLGWRLGESRGPVVARMATAGMVLAVVAFSAASLGPYYSTPKQAYRASIEYLESKRTNGEPVIVVDLAEQGYRYYGTRLGTRADRDYFFVQSVADLEAVLSSNSPQDSYVVTTLPRFLHQRKPQLEARIQEDWQIVRSFPGTIGNGQISVWASNQP